MELKTELNDLVVKLRSTDVSIITDALNDITTNEFMKANDLNDSLKAWDRSREALTSYRDVPGEDMPIGINEPHPTSLHYMFTMDKYRETIKTLANTINKRMEYHGIIEAEQANMETDE